MINSPFLLLIFTLTIRLCTLAFIIKPTFTTTSSANIYSNPIEESSQSTKQQLDFIPGLAPKENQKALQGVFISNFFGPSIWESPRIYHSPISSRKSNHQNNVHLPQKFSKLLQKRNESPNDQTETPTALDENAAAKVESTHQESTQDADVTSTSDQPESPAPDSSQYSETSSSADLAGGQNTTLPVSMDETTTESNPSAVDSSQENQDSSQVETSSEISTPEITSSISKDSTESEQGSSPLPESSPESGSVTYTYSQTLATEAGVETASSDTSTTTSQSSTSEPQAFIAKESVNLSPESGVVIEKLPNSAQDTSDVSKSEVLSTRTKLGNLTTTSTSVAIENDGKKTGNPCKSCGKIEEADRPTEDTLKSAKSTKVPSRSKEVTSRISSGERPSISSGDTPSISSEDSISVSSGELPIASNSSSSSTVNDTKDSKQGLGGAGYSSPDKKPSTTGGEEEKSSSKNVTGNPNDSKSGQTIKKEDDQNKSTEEKNKKERQSKALSIGIFSGLAAGLACTIFLAMIV